MAATKANKLTRKELAEPDQFITTSSRALDWLQANKTPFIGGGIAFVAIVVAVTVFQGFTEKQNAAAAEVFRAGMDIYNWQKPAPPKPGEEAAKDPKYDFADKKSQLSAALEKFEEVLDKHARSAVRGVALYYAGNTSFQVGETEKAERYLNEFLGQEGADSQLSALSHETLGFIAEAGGDTAKAREWFVKIAPTGEGFYAEYRIFHEARLDELAGDKDKAREGYQKIVDDFAESPAKRVAEARLGMLDTVVPDPATGAEKLKALGEAADAKKAEDGAAKKEDAKDPAPEGGTP